MPGNFIVKASQHPFIAGESRAVDITALPIGLRPNELELKYTYQDLKPVVGAPYLVLFDDGTQRSGNLDANGEAKIANPPGPGKAFFGYDQREVFPYPERPANPILGFKPTSPEDAAQALERYAKAEAEFMEDNYFPDEVAALYSGDEDYDDLLSDYEYNDEYDEVAIEEADEPTPETHQIVMLDELQDDASGAA